MDRFELTNGSLNSSFVWYRSEFRSGISELNFYPRILETCFSSISSSFKIIVQTSFKIIVRKKYKFQRNKIYKHFICFNNFNNLILIIYKHLIRFISAAIT